MKKKDFICIIEDFENKAVEALIESKEKLVIVKGNKFIGKTETSKKLFERVNGALKIYHTGCNPIYINEAIKEFIKDIDRCCQKSSNVVIILDEFYTDFLLQYISQKANITCYVFTNDNYLKCSSYVDFNYYYFYEKYIWGIISKEYICHKILNIREIIYMLEQEEECGKVGISEGLIQEFDEKIEPIRTVARQTMTRIREEKCTVDKIYSWR